MELGKENGFSVYGPPFSREDYAAMNSQPHIKVEPNGGTGWISDIDPTEVTAAFGSNIVYQDNVSILLPRFNQRLMRSRRRAAQRLLAHYAGRQDVE